jgi:hypothetical protein
VRKQTANLLILLAIFKDADVRCPWNSLCDIGNIAVKSVANLAEDREGQISFAPLDSPKVDSVQSAILGKAVLAKPQGVTFGLNPVPQPCRVFAHPNVSLIHRVPYLSVFVRAG